MTIEIPREWLRYAGTPEEFERARLEQIAAAFKLSFEQVSRKLGARPFGVMTDQWWDFIKKIEAKDELWFFSSSDDSFATKLGCQGYAIVHNGTIRETLITLRT